MGNSEANPRRERLLFALEGAAAGEEAEEALVTNASVRTELTLVWLLGNSRNPQIARRMMVGTADHEANRRFERESALLC